MFSDEGDILAGAEDPDLRYNQIIRPWKSRLGLFYIQNNSLLVDIKLILLTVVAIFSRPKALAGVQGILAKMGADQQLIIVAGRELQLTPYPPPGASEVVLSRN